MEDSHLPRYKLTDRFVRNVTPKGGGRDEYLDTVVPQLMLRVTPTGHKSFALVARFPGFRNPTRRLLGTFYDGDPRVLDQPDDAILDRDGAALSLAEARDKARMWFDRAVEWMDRHKPLNDELRRFRAEAETTLVAADKS